MGNGRRTFAVPAGALGLLLAGTLGVLFGAAGPARSQAPSPIVLELRLNGVVDPFTADYIRGGIDQANADGDAAVLLTIDTPGGLDSSMRQIIEAINGSSVPVICYVSPSGARAASAGTFIMTGCPVAAMAPGTNIGAAHPVGVSGVIEEQKVLNDAVATIRGLAEKYGRNPDWAEKAVRDSVSVPAPEALKLGVIDLIAPTVSILFADLDGRAVLVANGQHVGLRLAGATIETVEMGIGARILHALASPDFAFIFFYLGLGLLVMGFLHHPLAAVFGVISLLVAFVTFGELPVQLIGITLLLASVVFFLLELKHPGLGLPTVGGALCLVVGGLTLFNPSVPNARVSPLVIAPVAGVLVLFFGTVVNAALRTRGLPSQTRVSSILGSEGIVVRDLDPVGVVQVASEEWSAESVRGAPIKGQHVRVVEIAGLRLRVEPAEPSPTAPADREGRAS